MLIVFPTMFTVAPGSAGSIRSMDEDEIYSLQGNEDAEAKWYAYGADGVMLTEDDTVTSRPVRGPQQGEAQGGRAAPAAGGQRPLGPVRAGDGQALGFIDIARKTGKKLEFHFLPIDEASSFFLLTSSISRNI